MKKKTWKVHFVKKRANIETHTPCGKYFMDIEEMTCIYDEITCNICKKLVKPIIEAEVLCKHCGAEDSRKSEKQSVLVSTKKETWKYLTFDFCEECGHTTNVDLS